MRTQELEQEIRILKKNLLINNLFIIVFLGLILNVSVIMSNGLKMPVRFNDEGIPQVDNSYLPFKYYGEVKYAYLSDIFDIGFLKFSIGDFLIFFGILLIIFIFLHEQIINLKQRRINGIVINVG